MARTELERTILPSLLDRLTDEAPRAPADSPVREDESLRRYRRGVQRDLEDLLNTRRTIVPVGQSFPCVRNSVHEFGIPDILSSVPGSAEGRLQVIQDIRDTIQRFEPRLSDVQVRLAETDEIGTSQVRFIVEAVLHLDASSERVKFDSVLDASTGIIDVQDNR